MFVITISRRPKRGGEDISYQKSTFDEWLDSQLAGIGKVRERKIRVFVEEMMISKINIGAIKIYVKAILTLNFNSKPYEELTKDDLAEWKRQPNCFSSYSRRVGRFLRWVRKNARATRPRHNNRHFQISRVCSIEIPYSPRFIHPSRIHSGPAWEVKHTWSKNLKLRK